MHPPPKIGILLVNWNGKEDTLRSLSSLKQIKAPEFEVVIIDNGSTDGSQEAIRQEFPGYTLIETGENRGFAGGNNVGIAYGMERDFTHFLLLNNDTIVDPEILESFLKEFELHPEAGILGGKIYLMGDPKRLDHLGWIWNAKRLAFDFVGYRALDGEKWEQSLGLDYACGACLMIRREVFETIGVFDPRFFLFWEEADLCFRAKRAGFAVRTCPSAKLWHKVSASFTGGKPHAAYFVWRNRLLWIERNFSGSRRILYLTKLLGGSLPHFYSLKILRSLQLLHQKSTGANTARNRERLLRCNAALCGIHDYLLRRFGAGRSKNFMNCH